MSPPCRRLRRLRGSSANPAKSAKNTTNLLGSLIERDETPTQSTNSNLDTIVSSPLPPKTPPTTNRVKPSLEEMHPSKSHHSTAKEPDSGLRLGFTDINAKGNYEASGTTQQTPSKIGSESSSFDFRFAHPGPQLGPEAQRMMDDLREEALRIKAKLAAEREEEKRQAEEDMNTGLASRKIAQPKGKAGRFSDVHMANFKKMDSIAGHPSAFRAQPDRVAPVKSSLKRTQSKARLDERDEIQVERSTQQPTGRLENTAPAKRIRQNLSDDISSARPISRDGVERSKPLPSTPGTPRTKTNPLSSVLTPTQAWLARSATLKQSIPATQIPTLSRSPSKPNLNGTPQTIPKSATMCNINTLPRSVSKSDLKSAGRFDRVRSILKQPNLGSKKPSAIPSLTRSSSKPNLGKALPTIPTTPVRIERSKSVKHVNFTPDTLSKRAATVLNTPASIKTSLPCSISRINFARGSHSSGRQGSQMVEYPSIANDSSLGFRSEKVEYPSLPGFRPLPEPPWQLKSKSHLPPSVPGTFTFRADHTISFGPSPKGFGSSPGQSSLRQVRPSIAPIIMPGSFPDSNKENVEKLSAIAHGLSNKKRRRVDSDDEEDDHMHSPKKQKSNATDCSMLGTSRIMIAKKSLKPQVSSPAKKILSLSRLNMLARPKMRK